MWDSSSSFVGFIFETTESKTRHLPPVCLPSFRPIKLNQKVREFHLLFFVFSLLFTSAAHDCKPWTGEANKLAVRPMHLLVAR